MKTSKIIIKNLFGIRETTLDGKSVEISGPKGAGKTSVLDAIRFALTNRSERDCIVHQGADEGEIIIETTTGLSIDRKACPPSLPARSKCVTVPSFRHGRPSSSLRSSRPCS